MIKKKLILLGLTISVAINLFFIGGIAYRVTAFRGFIPRPMPPNVGWVVRDLSEERRNELAPYLNQRMEEIYPLREEMFAAQQRVNELMTMQPFDATAINSAFAVLRDVSNRYQTLSHEQTTTILNQLSEQERQSALEFLTRMGPRGERGGFRGMDRSSRFGAGRSGRSPFSPPERTQRPNPDR
ncbi:MAG: periplasmic heavy metal sensor [Proteobacteria bacterium]|nr:periplasmic heavy metal sensor [Pseudomonadota bacterium]